MRLRVSVAGHDDWYPGQEVDVDDETAAAWCDGVRAERVEVVDEAAAQGVAPALAELSVDDLWEELHRRGAAMTTTSDLGEYRVEVTTATGLAPTDPEEPLVPPSTTPPMPAESAKPKPIKNAGTRRGRPPKGEQALASPGGEQR